MNSNRTSENFASLNEAFDQSVDPKDQYNGRVNIIDQPPNILDIYTGLNTSAGQREDNSRFAAEAVSSQLSKTCLSDLFFSVANIDALQEGVRYSVYDKTNGRYTIGRQSDNELKIVMRSIFFQFAKHQSHNVVDQVKDLNSKVLAWCVKDVVANIQQNERYKHDVSTLPMPLNMGQVTSLKGTKSLELFKMK